MAAAPHPTHHLTFRAVNEPEVATRLAPLFHEFWKGYRDWFLRQGDQARPTYAESRRMLKNYMPELLPIYDGFVQAVGGGDVRARMLSLYRPTPYLSGCSQAVWLGDDPVLVRNYDYRPELCEGVLLNTRWPGLRVMAMSDCLWGALDGVNEAGLCAALSFGGRPVVGEGFGVPLVLRYVLQTCSSVAEAVGVLCRVPIHMAYNITLLDASGKHRTVQVAPDRPPNITDSPVATNHQGGGDWPRYAMATSSEEREQYLRQCVANPDETPAKLEQRFLQPPLHSRNYTGGWGTLYTATYRPREGSVNLCWPGRDFTCCMDEFREQSITIDLDAVTG